MASNSNRGSYEQVKQLVFQIEGAGAEFQVYLPAETGTILKLKQLIKVQVGVEVSRQTLSYNRVPLNDDNKLAVEEGLVSNGDVKLEVTPLPNDATFKIVVFGLAKNMSLEVTETETVLQLKNKIGMSDWVRREIGMTLPSNSIALWYMNWKMKDKKKLSYYYIHEGSRISSEMK